MTFVPREVQGVLASAFCALLLNCNMMISKLMQQWQWPYFFLAGSSCLIISVAIWLTTFCQGTYHMDSRDVKWVVLRGFFGCGSNVFTVCAVLAGAHVGSVGALSSVNTVVAALLGRLVLGEALGKLHVLAILLAVAGAVLISDPETMGTADSKILGNALALLAGICLGCMFISSRKSGKASAQILTCSAMAWRWVVCWVLAFCVPDGHFENFLTSPLESVSRAFMA